MNSSHLLTLSACMNCSCPWEITEITYKGKGRTEQGTDRKSSKTTNEQPKLSDKKTHNSTHGPILGGAAGAFFVLWKKKEEQSPGGVKCEIYDITVL